MKHKIEVAVCKTETDLSAQLGALPGVITTGRTLEEIKKNMHEVLDLYLKGAREGGNAMPEEFLGKYELVFIMDVESLLGYYQGIITQSAIARITGINVKQLNHYATGKSKPRSAQLRKIEEGLHKLGAELQHIQLQICVNK